MSDFAEQSNLDVWHARLPAVKLKRRLDKLADRPHAHLLGRGAGAGRPRGAVAVPGRLHHVLELERGR